MKIDVKLLCVDIPKDNSKGVLELPDGATVETAVERYALEYGLKIPVFEFKKSIFLINDTSARLGSELSGGDSLTIIRLLDGG